MPNNNFGELPIEGLCKLLSVTVAEMLEALDKNLDMGIAYKAKRKQVDLLLAEIERKAELRNKKKPDIPDLQKLELLKTIGRQARAGEATIFSFAWLAKETNLSHEQLDKLLSELEKESYIMEFTPQGSDNYKVKLHQKGLDVSKLTGGASS